MPSWDSSKYPVVLLGSLDYVLEELPHGDLVAPKMPRKPALYVPSEPKAPTRPDTERKPAAGYVISAVVAIIAAYGLMEAVPELGGLFFLVGLCLFIFAPRVSKRLDDYEREKLAYDKAWQEWKKTCDKAKMDYEAALDQYKAGMKEYEMLYRDYEDDLVKLWTPEAIEAHRREQIIQLYKEARLPELTPVNEKKREGINESKLYRRLQEKFPGNIFRNQRIAISFLEDEVESFDEFDDQMPEKSYYHPDITYHDPEAGILIDIEIDEPYDYLENKPIHHYDSWYNEGVDDFRNTYFNNSGWVVVRFAEKQVVYNLEECERLLTRLINILQKPHQWEEERRAIIKGFKDSFFVERWSEKDCEQMINERYRDYKQNDDMLIASAKMESETMRVAKSKRILISQNEEWRKNCTGKTFAQIGAELNLDPEEVKFGRNTLENGNVINSLLFTYKGQRLVLPMSPGLSEMRENNELSASFLLDCVVREFAVTKFDEEYNSTGEYYKSCWLDKPSTKPVDFAADFACSELSNILSSNGELDVQEIKQWLLRYETVGRALVGISEVDLTTIAQKNIFLDANLRNDAYSDPDKIAALLKFSRIFDLLYWKGQFHLPPEQRKYDDPRDYYYHPPPASYKDEVLKLIYDI